ncbi:MAG: carbamoyltransferase HypF, partial [Bacteroidota bacterium]
MRTWHIWIKGQVQGVGFRPFVYQTADRFQLKGWVNNTTDGVHVEFNATEGLAQDFYQCLTQQAPILARITAHQMHAIEDKFFEKFQIIKSTAKGKADLLLTPDAAMCPKCRQELHDPKNRRFRYPFITCTDCGVRFSIVSELPYDRERTTMAAFQMCNHCIQEYNDPWDRRYFSQTNSCPDCSIELAYLNPKGPIKQVNLLAAVVADWEAGKVVAIKGIGGYLLTCAADQPSTIARLRERKHRPSKAFAVMFPDLKRLDKIAMLSAEDKKVLDYPVAAITLVEMKPEAKSMIAIDEITPGLKRVGALLPYAPLFDLLLKDYGKAIIATSGNVSNAPIVFQDDQALESLFSVADTILSNNREIVVPQDDSVVQFSQRAKQQIILRRSRGWAPTHLQSEMVWPQQTVLAMGAMLKSTFTLLHQGNVYVSQYLGNLEHFDTEQHYRHTVDHYLNLLGATPELILCDQHPDYPSQLLGRQLAEAWDVPLVKFQHHEAHFAAVLGENNLLDTSEAILGVVWDGTGLGRDGQIWGGEFFVYQDYAFERVAHWPYQASILGDKMAKEPRISAISFFGNTPGATSFLKPKFT